MKIFISWSGERSNQIAEKLKEWLLDVFQNSIEPFVSSEDISIGKLWRPKVAEELQASNFGIICVTHENYSNPWLIFEAGALSKEIHASTVVPLFFGIKPSNLTGNPLADYQGTQYSEKEIKKLIYTINEKTDTPSEKERLDRNFEVWYPRLKSDIDEILSQQLDTQGEETIVADPAEIMEELLIVSRANQKMLSELAQYDELRKLKSKESTPAIVQSLMDWAYELAGIIRKNQKYDFVMEDSTFKKDGNPAIKITGVHEYTVANSSESESLYIPLDMIDELGLQSSEDGWGFESFFYTISGDEKKSHLITDSTKRIKLTIEVPPGKNVRLEFVSSGLFLPSDRYAWYSQDFCENCRIVITNNTTISQIRAYQLNHRDEAKIRAGLQDNSNPNIINININIYPREGFTMYWKQKEV